MKAYGDLQLTVSSPEQTFNEVLTRAQARTWLHLDEMSPPNFDQDDLIDSLIVAAREVCEIEQGFDLIPKQYDLSLDTLYPCRWDTPWRIGDDLGIDLRYPLQSVDLFQITDVNGEVTTLVEGINDDYRVDLKRGRLLPPYGKTWPFFTFDVSSAVLIRFTSGYTANHPYWRNSGQRVLQAMRLLICGWFEGRYPYADVRATVELPFAVTALLQYGARPRVH